jgi:hypothetical protein
MNIRDIIAVVCITTLVSFAVQYVTLNSSILKEEGHLLEKSEYLDFNVESIKRTGETIVESTKRTGQAIVEAIKMTGDIQPNKMTIGNNIESKDKTRDKSDYGIHIIGERHTGTSWLQIHLQQCFGDQVKVYDRLSRHKYWFQLDDETKDYGLVVATFRNVYDWLEAMRRKPLHAPSHYHHGANQPLGMRSFVQSVWLPTRYDLV